jgi:serine/threonine protein kinase
MNESEASPNMENKCPQCGTPLPSGGLAGLCPACLLKQAATETAVPTSVPNFQPPTVEELARLFPQLEIISLIGRGGMGAVYKARQPLLDRIVALKILPAAVTRGTDFGDRFTREARALAKLNHPNIVMVYEFGQITGQPYFIMEFVDGVNLRQLEREGRLTPREALLIVPQICEALQFAHDAGIVHRDIKPDNILLDKKGRVKIADFGIAKILGTSEDPAIPVTQGAIGTPHYMAPEQVERPQTVDHRADIFSLGVVFYEMLTGELPLGRFAPPSSGPRGVRVDVRLDEVVLRALEREPDLRYQHASQVKTAVDYIAGTTAQTGSPDATPNNVHTEALLARDYHLEIRHSISRGWKLYTSAFWPLTGVTALILTLMAIAGSAFQNTQHNENGTTVEGLSVLGLLLTGPLLAGLFYYFLKKIRGEAATVETAFTGFFSRRFLHLFLGFFVTSALTALGFVCLVLPGIYLFVAWIFTLALVIDKGLDFWPAMELSRRMVHKHWWKVLLLLIEQAALMLGGLLCCGVGIFFAAPWMVAAFMYAYEDIFGSWPAAGPLAGRPVPASPAAFGPAGTMVMPGAGGTPPPIAPATSIPVAAAPAGKGPNPWLKYGLIGAAGLAVLIAVVALLPSFRLKLANLKMAHNFGEASIRRDEPAAPVPPENVASPAYAALVERTRQELEKISVRFDQLYLASGSDSNLVVSFTGLRKLAQAGTNAAASGGILISNPDAVVSISGDGGVKVSDNKNPATVSISLPFLHINVNKDTDDSGQDIDGTLVGARQTGTQWSFAGTGPLAAVKFEMTNLDLTSLLAPPTPPAVPADAHETLNDRLDAAKTITDDTVRDKSLAALAADAVDAGDVEMAKSALQEMADTDDRDAATRDCALQFAKNGRRKAAVEMAGWISDSDLRDKTLAELAQ